MANTLQTQYCRVQSKIKAARNASLMDMKSAAMDAIDESNKLIGMLINEIEALKKEVGGNA